MKTLFIPARSTIDIIPIIKKVNIKGNIGLVTTIQFLHKLRQARKLLKNSVIGGQILGCNLINALKIKSKVDSFLYIGSGKFHPLYLAIKTNKPVYIANPLSSEITRISEREIKDYKNKQKAKLIKFYKAKKIGILISTKPGQYHPKKYLNLKQKISQAIKVRSKVKNSYLFIFNTLDEKELENFPDIDIWINLACPTIEHKNIINIEDLPIR